MKNDNRPVEAVEEGTKTRSPFPAYSRIPDAVFEVGLSPNEIAIYAYLTRLIGKGGLAYPKAETICKKTGIRSKVTVRRGLRSLSGRGFIEMVSPASHRAPAKYRVKPFAVEAAAKVLALSNQDSENISEAEDLNESQELSGGDSEPKYGFSASVESRGTRDIPQGDTTYHPECHDISPRVTRRITEGRSSLKEVCLKEDFLKDSPPNIAPPPQGGRALVFSNENTLTRTRELDNKSKQGVSIGGPQMSAVKRPEKYLLVKANEYYYGLTETEREIFDREACRLYRSKSKPSLAERRELRQNYFGLIKFAQSTYLPDSVAVELAARALNDSRATRIVSGELACA